MPIDRLTYVSNLAGFILYISQNQFDNQWHTAQSCYVRLLSKQGGHTGVHILHPISETTVCKVVYRLSFRKIEVMGKANRIRDE